MLLRTLGGLVLLLAACERPAGRQTAADSTPPVAQADTRTRAAKPDLIRLDQPLSGALITSPLAIAGEARGQWYFEASFPVYLLNAAGDTIVATPAQAEGEWMTSNFVPFKATLTFTTPSAQHGTLILSKSNASGLPEHDDELRVPIRFP
jgi:hypothetical protein